MERFVELIVAGGLAMVAGLWLAALAPGSLMSVYGGAAIAVGGAVALLWGIRTELTV